MLGRLLIATLLFACGSARASAQGDCPPPPRGPLETTPISGSSGVATNAIFRALYPSGHLDTYAERIEIVSQSDPSATVVGSLERAGDTLFFVPDADLAPRHTYVARATGVDSEIYAEFTTGDGRDLEPPSAPELLESEAGVASATCAMPEGGVRLSFVFETSTDDVSVASLKYALYRTRGPELVAPEVIARASQEVPGGELQSIGAVLSERDAAGVSCFVLVAEDGLSQTTSSDELCFEPGIGVIFDSLCSTSDPAAAAKGLWPTLLLLAAVAARRRRRPLA